MRPGFEISRQALALVLVEFEDMARTAPSMHYSKHRHACQAPAELKSINLTNLSFYAKLSLAIRKFYSLSGDFYAR
jgi:hypothetical protein